MTTVIQTDRLTKTYGRRTGCEGICLSVSEGQIFGLLGPNGAGKSTLVKMLVGLLHPTSGSAEILGRPLGDLEARRQIGFLPENFRYHEWLTGQELLSFHGSLYRMDPRGIKERVSEVLRTVGLERASGQRIGTYSKGMQQRLGLASALLPDPALLFLDEPTSALDPLGRREVREIMLELKRRGKTVFLNSHLLSEVEMICDQVAMIREGRIAAAGALDELLSARLEVEMEIAGFDAGLRRALEAGGRTVEPAGGQGAAGHGVTGDGVAGDGVAGDGVTVVRVGIRDRDEIPALAQAVVDGGGRLYSLRLVRDSLEDLFVDLMKGGGS